MSKRFIVFILFYLLLTSTCIAYAHPEQSEHDDELKRVLFGQVCMLTGDKEVKFQAIADAAALCIDQFSPNENVRYKEELFNSLNERERFSFSFDDIELQKGIGGINVVAKTHRIYTHRGWDFQEYPLKELWMLRKKILTETINNELFDEPKNLIKRIPFVGDLIYSEDACNDRCEAFSKLVYYIHILGDYREATCYSSEFQQLIPLTRHEDRTSPALIRELIDSCRVLFSDQQWSLNALVQELEDIENVAESILAAEGGIRTQEQFVEYHNCAEDVFEVLEDMLPSMLRKVDFLSNTLY